LIASGCCRVVDTSTQEIIIAWLPLSGVLVALSAGTYLLSLEVALRKCSPRTRA
jgi:hypothetical protein